MIRQYNLIIEWSIFYELSDPRNGTLVRAACQEMD